MKRVRLGIIGPGIIWDRVHKPVLKKLSDKFEIAAFCATSDKSRGKIFMEYPDLPFFKDYNELLKSSFIDTAVVLTPLSMNSQVAFAALDSGKDVIMEKPMAVSYSSGLELLKKEEKSGKRVFILEQNAYLKQVDEFLKIISLGKIGDLVTYEKLYHGFIHTSTEKEEDYGNTKWRINPDFPLGTLFDSGIHEIAMLSKIFGNPESAFSTGNKFRQEYGEYDFVLSIFEYSNKAKGAFSHSFFLGDSRNYFNVRGTEGIAYFDNDSITTELKNGYKEIVPVNDDDVHERMWSLFADCFEQNSLPYYTTKVSLGDLKTLEAIGKSLKERTVVAI
jgi:scyllo-inositol 2-dehydrogenase (NADP+)